MTLAACALTLGIVAKTRCRRRVRIVHARVRGRSQRRVHAGGGLLRQCHIETDATWWRLGKRTRRHWFAASLRYRPSAPELRTTNETHQRHRTEIYAGGRGIERAEARTALAALGHRTIVFIGDSNMRYQYLRSSPSSAAAVAGRHATTARALRFATSGASSRPRASRGSYCTKWVDRNDWSTSGRGMPSSTRAANR